MDEKEDVGEKEEFDWFEYLNKVSPLLTLSGLFIMTAAILVSLNMGEENESLIISGVFFLSSGLFGILASFIFILKKLFESSPQILSKIVSDILDVLYQIIIVLFVVCAFSAMVFVFTVEPFKSLVKFFVFTPLIISFILFCVLDKYFLIIKQFKDNKRLKYIKIISFIVLIILPLFITCYEPIGGILQNITIINSYSLGSYIILCLLFFMWGSSSCVYFNT